MMQKEKLVKLMDGDVERTFKIKKFNALVGSYILYNILNKVLPAFLQSELSEGLKAQGTSADDIKNLSSDKLAGVATALNKVEMSRDEFMQLQRDCLSVCYEVLPGREAPVIDATGNFGVIGLDDNTGLVMSLTIQSLLFNVKGFFFEGGLTSAMKSLAE